MKLKVILCFFRLSLWNNRLQREQKHTHSICHSMSELTIQTGKKISFESDFKLDVYVV